MGQQGLRLCGTFCTFFNGGHQLQVAYPWLWELSLVGQPLVGGEPCVNPCAELLVLSVAGDCSGGEAGLSQCQHGHENGAVGC